MLDETNQGINTDMNNANQQPDPAQNQRPEPQVGQTPPNPQQTQQAEPKLGTTMLGGEGNPAPVSYDFQKSIPEGFEFSQEEAGRFTDVIKDMGLNNEQANAVAAYGFDFVQRAVEAVAIARDQEVASWGETARKELGAELDSTMQLCGAGIEAIEKSVPGLRQALNESGAGNRIEIIRAFKLLGEMVQGDPGKAIGSQTGQPDTNKTWYPNSKM